ncbi:calcium-binding protein [Sphingomonas arantia]|uniref:Calcium-binding protein n=1 Tax=Sphingomonas arantia TaxID=1460676 RepID=A0ABW4TWC2_9SPHN
MAKSAYTNDVIDGTDGDDILNGTDGSDTIYGYAGNDFINGSLGADVLDGGEGDDVFRFSVTDDSGEDLGTGSIIGGEGNDLLDLSGIAPTTIGAVDTDDGESLGVFVGTQRYALNGIEQVIVRAGSYVELFTGSEGAQLQLDVVGSANTEIYLSGNRTVNSGSGDDYIFASGIASTKTTGAISGGDGVDTLGLDNGFQVDLAAGTAYSASSFFALSGIENVIAAADGGSRSSIAGDDNANVFSVLSYADDGQTGITFDGRGGNDTITGSTGNDLLIGGEGNDLLTGGLGIDTLSGGLGDDTLYGNQGDDNLNGGDGADTLFGGQGNDLLTAGLGNDTLFGNIGDDTLYGNQGDDTLSGDAGNDSLFGGQGNDLVSGGDGNDTLFGNLGNDVLYGNIGADTLQGDDGDDILYGNQDNDVLYGNVGNDTLYGGQGDDLVYGGRGDDQLFGNLGNDVLQGGLGSDTLTGGSGADMFRFVLAGDSTVAASDVITDFETTVDKIDAQGLYTNAADSFQITSGGGNTFVDFDLGGNGSIDLRVQVTGENAVTASDVLFGTPSVAAFGADDTAHAAMWVADMPVITPDVVGTW